ncbi:MAG: phosphatidate cytidylyltransferase [Kiritimatiellae bacterium]|nr:phosphatidate cytidylyltransferase [Kiritimatiellia bacterium]
MNKVFKRTVTALATAAAVIAAMLWLPKAALVPAMTAAVVLVHFEFSRLVAKKYPVMVFPGVAAGLLYMFAQVYAPRSYIAFPAVVFMLFLAVLLSKAEKPVVSLAFTVLGIVYIPVFLSPLLLIARDMDAKWLLYTVSIIKISDMGGFAFGMAFGRHKMCPSISPGKSWEGMAGSVFASCLISCLFMPVTSFGVLLSLAFGVAAAVLGTLGDLAESRIKREIGVKDSAVFMPAGMGGFLDMFDSLVFASALLYPFLRYFAA